LKLKTGSGEQVLQILNQLASKAMKKKNFSFKKPKYEDIKAEYPSKLSQYLIDIK
jgi:hypothetical protein